MSVYDEWRNRKKKRELDRKDNEVFKRFKQQKRAINDIRNTDGLNEILTYFRNAEDTSTQKILYCAENEREKLIARATVAKEFRRFIENLFMADDEE